jgi:hypothetical protein
MGRRLTCTCLAVSTLLACKAIDDQASRPLPAPEPPATTQPSLAEASTPPADKPRERPREPRPSENDAPSPTSSANTAPAASVAAPTTPASAAAPAAAPNAGCQHACQAGLQTCLSQQPADPDGGTNLEGLATCKRALDECKAKCSP